MKFKKIIIISILLAILAIGAVSASDDVSNMTVDDASPVLEEMVDSDNLEEPKKELDYDIYMPDESLAGSDDEIDIYFPGDTKGNLTVKIDDDVLFNESYIGYTPLSIDAIFADYDNKNLKPIFGEHTAFFIFSGDDKYAGFNVAKPFNYTQMKVTLPELVNIGGDYGDTLNVEFPNDAQGTVTIYIDGKEKFKETFDEGTIFDYDFEGISFGTHTYKVDFKSDDKNYYPNVQKSGKFSTDYLFEFDKIYGQVYSAQNYIISFTLPDDVNGKAVLNINGKNYDVNVEEGVGKFNFNQFKLGENFITATFANSNYHKKTINMTVDCSPYVNHTNVVNYGEDALIEIALPSDAAGNLTVKVDENDTYFSVLKDGVATIAVRDLAIGDHSVEFNYAGDYDSLVNYLYFGIEVVPGISIPSNMWVKDRYNITFKGPKDYNSVFKVESEIFNASANIVNGEAIIPLTGLKAGQYTFKVKYDDSFEDEYEVKIYENASDSIDFEFTDSVFKFMDSDGPYIYLDDIMDEISGDAIVYLDGKKYGLWGLDERAFELLSDDLSLGKHTLKIVFGGDDYFKPVTKTLPFEVVNIYINIPNTVYVNTDNAVTVYAPYDATGTVTVYVDGKKFSSKKFAKTDDDQEVYFDLSRLSNAKHYIEVKYSGGNYPAVSKKLNVDVNYDIPIDLYSCIYGDDNSFTFNLPADVSKKATVLVDGVEYKYVTKDGENYVNISDLGLGSHNISVTYPGDAKFSAKTVTENFEVYPEIRYDSEVDFKNIASFCLKLPKDRTGILYLYIGDELYGSAEMRNGIANINYNASEIGEYSFKVNFIGDVSVDEIESELTVKPIISAPSVMYVGDEKYLTFESGINGDLEVLINDELYDNYGVYGMVRVPLNDLPIANPCKLNLVFYPDDVEIGSFEDSCDITVKPYSPKLVGAKDLSMYYNDGTKISLKVYGIYGKLVGAGEIVNFRIGSKNYKVKTDKKGVATLKITDLPKKYTVTASYKGVKVTKKLTVKQVLTLKTVKVKKSAKKLVLTATLKKGKKAIKNKKITFKFNGKKYTAKTNKKGIAKVTINKKVLKKLKVGKKVTYQVTYVKDTVKRTVKVKR